MKHYRACTQIAADIGHVLEVRGLTLRECVDLYNRTHAAEIAAGVKTPLNKDFVQRLRSGKCKVVSTRVLDLCAFLEINPCYSVSSDNISREFANIENLIRQNPLLEQGIVRLLQDVGRLAGLGLPERNV